MKHPLSINGIEQMFSVSMVRDVTVKAAAKQNKNSKKARGDIYGNDYITCLHVPYGRHVLHTWQIRGHPFQPSECLCVCQHVLVPKTS